MKLYKYPVSFVLTLLFSHSVFAEKVFVMGVENQPYMPHFSYENGEYKGFARKLFDTFGESRGYKFEYKPLPINRLFKMMLDGQIDFKYPDSPLWQEDLKKNSSREVIYSDKVSQYTDATMVLPENQNNTLENFKIIGTVRGFSPWTYMELIKEGKVSIHENSDLVGLLKQTLMGRVDGAYLNLAVANYELKKINKSNALLYNEKLPHSTSYYYLSTTTQAQVITEFNEFLARNQKQILELKKQFNVVDR